MYSAIADPKPALWKEEGWAWNQYSHPVKNNHYRIRLRKPHNPTLRGSQQTDSMMEADQTLFQEVCSTLNILVE